MKVDKKSLRRNFDYSKTIFMKMSYMIFYENKISTSISIINEWKTKICSKYYSASPFLKVVGQKMYSSMEISRPMNFLLIQSFTCRLMEFGMWRVFPMHGSNSKITSEALQQCLRCSQTSLTTFAKTLKS